jgi:hypothetical protein
MSGQRQEKGQEDVLITKLEEKRDIQENSNQPLLRTLGP